MRIILIFTTLAMLLTGCNTFFVEQTLTSTTINSTTTTTAITTATTTTTTAVASTTTTPTTNSSTSTSNSITTSSSTSTSITTTTLYPLHQNINCTEFWVGEAASEDNGYISNVHSAWDDMWTEHYGGTDEPESRNGYYPAGFTPLENPFYFALPYNDYEDGEPKVNSSQVYWANEKIWVHDESKCKNRWIKVIKGTLEAYAQWQDTGPYLDDDINYVFGTAAPSNTDGTHSGLDLSPAVNDYLGLDGTDVVSWQFVPSSEVPSGPWKNIITTSQICW